MEWYLILIISGLALLFLMMMGVPIAFSLGFMAFSLDLFSWAAHPVSFRHPGLRQGQFLWIGGRAAIHPDGRDNHCLGSGPGRLCHAQQVDRRPARRLGHRLPDGLHPCSRRYAGPAPPPPRWWAACACRRCSSRGYDKKSGHRLHRRGRGPGGAHPSQHPADHLRDHRRDLHRPAYSSRASFPACCWWPGGWVTFLVLATVKPQVAPRVTGFTWRRALRLSVDDPAVCWPWRCSCSPRLYFGLATPSEVAGVGALAALVLICLSPTAGWTGMVMKESLQKTTRTTCFILWILVAASSFRLCVQLLAGAPATWWSGSPGWRVNRYRGDSWEST